MSTRITAVVGFIRSGSTMTLNMIKAGGVPAYESGHVNSMSSSWDWLKDCEGKVCRIEGHQLPPQEYAYDFIWTRRDPKEQAKSQIKFITEFTKFTGLSLNLKELAEKIILDTQQCQARLKAYPDSRMLVLNFEETLRDPYLAVIKMMQFIDRTFDHTTAAAKVVVNRPPECYGGFLEKEIYGKQ